MTKFKKLLLTLAMIGLIIPVQAKRAYFLNDDNWGAVCAYAWIDSPKQENGGWPGVNITSNTITTTDGKTLYWYDDGGKNYEKIIFNNNNQGKQTKDIPFATDPYVYCYTKNNNSNGTVDNIGWISESNGVYTFHEAGEVVITYNYLYFPVSTYNNASAYLYTWNPGLTAGYPGDKLEKKTINGNDFWVWEKDDREFSGQTTFGGLLLSISNENGKTQKENITVAPGNVIDVSTWRVAANTPEEWNQTEQKTYDYYLVGVINGWDANNPDYGFVQSSSNANIYELQLTEDFPQQFKILDKDGKWCGSDETVDVNGASVNSTIQIIYDGGNDINFSSPSIKIKDAKLTLDTSTWKLTITGTTGIIQHDLYLIGDVNGWNQTDPSYKFNTTDYNTYTLKLDSFEAGSTFKFGNEGWALSLTANKKDLVAGETYTLQSGGTNNDMALAVDMVDITFTVDLSANSLIIEGTEKLGAPDELYVIGTIKDSVWKPEEGLKMTKNNNVFTIEGVELVNDESNGAMFSFITKQNSDWNNVGSRFGADVNSGSDVNIESGQSYDLVRDANPKAFIGEAGTYSITVDFDTDKMTATWVPAEDVTTELYLYGTLNKNGEWNVANKNDKVGIVSFANEGDGGFLASEVAIYPAPENEFGYITLSTANGTEWSVVNDGQHGPEISGTEAKPDEELAFSQNTHSWKVKPAVYDVYVDFNEKVLTLEWVSELPEDELDVDTGVDDTVQSGSVSGTTIKLQSLNDKVIFFVTAPEDATAVYYKVEVTGQVTTGGSDESQGTEPGLGAAIRGRLAAEEGYTEAKTYVAPEGADDKSDEGKYYVPLTTGTTGTVDLYYESNAYPYTSTPVTYNYTVTRETPTGVEVVIEAADGEVQYFNLDGVRVYNPEKGIFIKVANGKAEKVVK